jgi:hypothetical protein
LICSDGLTKMQTDEQIAKILKNGAKDPLATVAQTLINTANEAGGKDNVTAVLVKAGDISGAPNVIDPDEEDEDKTIAAPAIPPPIEAPTPANYPAQVPAMPDTADVHGETPHTDDTVPEKVTADKPTTPVPVPVPVPVPAPKPILTSTPTPAPAAVPVPKAAADIPTAKKETKPEAKPEIMTSLKPEKKKSFPLSIVIVVAVILAAGAGIWFAVSSKSKTAEPGAALPAKPAVSNPPPMAVATTPARPAPQPAATNPAPDQSQAANQAAGREALKNAQAAFDSRDYKNAAALAAAALQKIPSDAAALKLQADAQAQLKIQDAWRAALNQAKAAFDNKDYKTAATKAVEALQKIPNEQTATKLRDSALQQISAAAAAQEQVQKYQAALSEAKEAYNTKKFMLADTKAKEVLAMRPNDPEAEQIIQQMQLAMDLEDARRHFDQAEYDLAAQICQSHPTVADFKQLAANCQAEQTALADAKNLFNAGDYSFVARIQNQAYASKTPFKGLLNQAAGEQKLLADLEALKKALNWKSVADNLASPAFSPVTNKAAFRALGDWAEKQKRLQQLTVTFEQMLVWFNIKNPTDSYITTAEAKKQRTVNGALSGVDRQKYLDTTTLLENEFGKLGILNQNDRAKYLKELKNTIGHHE